MAPLGNVRCRTAGPNARNRRKADPTFNVDGGKLIVIILAALVVLGPEELPGMLRRVGRLYGELRRLSDGVQHDLRSTFADPAN